MHDPKTIARKLASAADRLGWTLFIDGGILTITKRFTPDDVDGFIECDMEYYDILGLLPQTSEGSIWGTDGGGVGALSAMKSGVFRMNKSGGSKRVLSHLAKLLD